MIPNPCHSKDRPTPETTITVQDGWAIITTNRNRQGQHGLVALKHEIKHAMSCACVYGPMNNDPRCGAFPDLNLPVCPHKEKKDE
jgi:hypothetical protein